MSLRGGRGQRGNGRDGKGRGLLGALLSWQGEGGGGWLCHPIASPPVLRKTTVSVPETKTQPRISRTQALDARKMLLTALDVSYCTGVVLCVLGYFSIVCLFRAPVKCRLPFLTLPCPFDTAWRNAISHMWWGYSCMVGRVCPRPQIMVVVAGWCSLSSQTGNLHSWEESGSVWVCACVGGGGLINEKECYLQFRQCFIWVSLMSCVLLLQSVGTNIDRPYPLCMHLVIAF